jgi:hypothetical protein
MAPARRHAGRGKLPAKPPTGTVTGVRKGGRVEGITFTTVDGATSAPGAYFTERLNGLNLLPSGSDVKAIAAAIDMMFESPNWHPSAAAR